MKTTKRTRFKPRAPKRAAGPAAKKPGRAPVQAKLPIKDPKVKKLGGPPEYKVRGVPGKDGDHGQVWEVKLQVLKGHAHKFRTVTALLGEPVRVHPQHNGTPPQDLRVLSVFTKTATDPTKPPTCIVNLTGNAKCPGLLGQVVKLERLQRGLFEKQQAEAAAGAAK